VRNLSLTANPDERVCFGDSQLWSLWELMEIYKIGDLLDNVGPLSVMAGAMNNAARIGQPWRLTVEAQEICLVRADTLIALLERLDAPVILAAIKQVRLGYEKFGKPVENLSPPTLEFRPDIVMQMFKSFEHFSICFKDEIGAKTVFSISSRFSPYFNSTVPLFGGQVADAFPRCMFDITEAGDCIALERSTACVFHLMRVMESAIRAVARCLGIPDPVKPAEKNWGAISRTIQKEMKARNTVVPPRWTNPDDRIFFDEIFVLMEAVRAVWRKPTMHPDRKHTPEEALSILGAVKTFMTKISLRLDEDGLPLA